MVNFNVTRTNECVRAREREKDGGESHTLSNCEQIMLTYGVNCARVVCVCVCQWMLFCDLVSISFNCFYLVCFYYVRFVVVVVVVIVCGGGVAAVLFVFLLCFCRFAPSFALFLFLFLLLLLLLLLITRYIKREA